MGWQHTWYTSAYFEDFPIPTKEAARWLASFKLKGVGIHLPVFPTEGGKCGRFAHQGGCYHKRVANKQGA